MKKLLTLCILSTMISVPVQAKTINMGEFKLTAYCPCEKCSKGYGRNTTSGKKARSEHTIAVDKSRIDIGSRVKIGDTIYTAEDTGGGVEGDHIDIFFDTHEEVEEFGVKYKNVKIVRKDKKKKTKKKKYKKRKQRKRREKFEIRFC